MSGTVEEIPQDAEVEVGFVPDDFGIKITAVLGEASITVEHSWDAGDDITTLVAALPNILEAVQASLSSQEEA